MAQKTRKNETGKSALDTEQMIQLTLRKYSGFLKTKPAERRFISNEELKKDFGLKSPNAVSKIITRAFKEGLVKVVRADDTPTERRPDLENELRRLFPKLQQVIVVGTPANRKAWEGRPDRNPLEDPLYQALGGSMAAEIANGFLIRNTMRVGVGSGRAVYQMVKSLERYKPLRFADLTLWSLTGTVWSFALEKSKAFWLDSDLNVALLWGCFSVDNTPVQHYIGYPLTYPGRGDTWMGKHDLDRFLPSVALVGVGTLYPGHRFWVEDDANGEVKQEGPIEPILAPILDDLKELRRRIQPFVKSVATGEEDDYYSPVSDTSNHLFFVTPPKDAEFPREHAERIQQQVALVNSKLLALDDEQFSRIETLALIAGSKSKACAINELLIHDRYNVQSLAVDEEAAALLVSGKLPQASWSGRGSVDTTEK